MTSEPVEISDRELEILQLVATGATNQQIAQQLHISTNTVKVHLRNINSKIGAASRTEATLYALRRGWVKLDEDTLPDTQSAEAEGVDSEEAPALSLANRSEPLAAERPTTLDTLAIDAAVPPDQAPLAQSTPRNRWALPVGLGLLGVALVLLLVMFVMQPDFLRQDEIPAPTDPNTGQVQSPDAVPPIIDTSDRWQTLTPMPAPRAGFSTARYELDGQAFLYAIGGSDGDTVHDSVFRFDVNSNRWTQRASKPTAVSDVQAVVVGSSIYVPGGRLESGETTDVFEVYDPVRDSWKTAAPLPEPRSAYALAAIEGKIYLFGGWDGGQYRAEVWQYNPDQDTWIEQTPMNQPRAYASAAMLNGRIHIIGGEDETGALTLHERYNPAAEDSLGPPWDLRARLPEARSNTAASSSSGIIFVIGGNADVPLLLYDASLDEWQQQSIPLDPLAGLRTEMIGNRLYILGGANEAGTSAQIYDYQTLYTVVVPLGS
jgi:DNA-binding CsgD family transcriptional regulator